MGEKKVERKNFLGSKHGTGKSRKEAPFSVINGHRRKALSGKVAKEGKDVHHLKLTLDLSLQIWYTDFLPPSGYWF